MTPQTLNITAWVLWIAIGIVAGLVSARMGGGRRLVAYNVVIGLVAAVVGGLASAYAVGDASMQLVLISALVAALVAAAVLWVFNMLLMRGRGNDGGAV